MSTHGWGDVRMAENGKADATWRSFELSGRPKKGQRHCPGAERRHGDALKLFCCTKHPPALAVEVNSVTCRRCRGIYLEIYIYIEHLSLSIYIFRTFTDNMYTLSWNSMHCLREVCIFLRSRELYILCINIPLEHVSVENMHGWTSSGDLQMG